MVNEDFNQFSKEKLNNRSPLFKSVLRAAFTKCFEFNHFISRPRELKSPFFLLGTVRSICEDLICLSYLKKLKANQREELIRFNHNFDIAKNIIAQKQFFDKYNAGQFVVQPDHFADEDYLRFVTSKPHSRTKALKTGYNLYPSVFEMAKDAGYLDLYNYLYHASSSLVHFRSDVLLKLGWNKDQSDKRQNIYRYSTNKYSDYYAKFNLVYSGLLFCEFVFKFSKYLGLAKSLVGETNYFTESFALFDWPEIMTYDHMNLQQPTELHKQLRRSHFVVDAIRRKKPQLT